MARPGTLLDGRKQQLRRAGSRCAQLAAATLHTAWPASQGGPGCSSLFGTFYLNGPYALQVRASAAAGWAPPGAARLPRQLLPDAHRCHHALLPRAI